MPTYEYECSNCEHTFEEFQSMTDKALRKCPKCGKLKLQRLIGAGAGIIFKGSGFYETDYKRKPQGKITDNSGPSDSSASSKTESSSGSGDASKGSKPSSEAKAS
jgi:putative regulatory protein, FmdB family